MSEKNSMAASGTKRWVDLGVDGVEVVIADFDATPGEKAVVIRGPGDIGETSAGFLASAGFHRFDASRTIFARRGSSFRKSDLLNAFPSLRVREFDIALTRKRYRGSTPFARKPVFTPPVSEPVHAANATAIAKGNLYQTPYLPRSRIGTPIAMIPVNMEEATAKAFDRLEREHGPIDAFVSGLLKVDNATMAKMLSPEQIDAIGMGIATILSGREFILADATGLGKGRVLAGLAMAARLLGRRVVFITEKANLFSDFWRDVIDIGAAPAIGPAFILNSEARVIDVTSPDGAVVFEAPRDDVIRKVVRSKALPPNVEFAMTTYSQFNRAGSPKSAFFSAISKDALVIVDESQNAIGDSNTALGLQAGFDNAWGVIRSSATFARKLANLLSYGSVLPPSIRRDNPKDLLESGGNALAEAMSQYLAEDGVLLRREHDLSEIKINVLMDDGHRDRNRMFADSLAPILSRMAKLSRLANDEAELKNENAEGGKGKRAFWYAANFGSRLSPLIRQFVTALTVDFCVERCLDALMNNEKPVVVIESTMESLMRELSADKENASGEGGDEGISSEVDAERSAGSRPPDFRAALSTMLDRIMTISCKVSKDLDPERHPIVDPFAVAEAAQIRALIDAFPDLSLSPIDDLRDRIEAEGRRLAASGEIEKPWRADEISARRLKVSNGLYEQIPPMDRNETIVAFNGGASDALVITRAASTGLSLHASERVGDKRRRRMIELQIPANVVERIQFWGRVNRRGQVCVPGFETLCSGLPLQMRTMAMENRKVEALSANVSASAASNTAMDVPDVMDSLGNEIAQRMLEEQPHLAERMCIAMRVDPEQAEHDLYFINKLLQRLCLLSSDEQDTVFNQLVVDYADALAALRARGQTPRGTRELDGRWREVSREIYEDGNPADGPVFGRPIDLVTMEAVIEKNPMGSSDISHLIATCRKRLGEAADMAVGPYFVKEIKAIKSARRRVLSNSLSARLVSVDSALALPGDNAVKTADRKLKDLIEIVAELQPGSGITVPGEEGDPLGGVLVDIRAPDTDEVHLPGRWSIRFVTPGMVHPKEVSLATVMRDDTYIMRPPRHGEIANPDLSAFDRAPRGSQTEQRLFLDGNLVKAVAVASEVSAGTMVTYTDAEGVQRRSVLINRRGRGALVNRSRSTESHAEVVAMIEDGETVWTNGKKKDDGLILRPDGQHVMVEIPKGKAGKRFETDAIMRIVGKFRLNGDYRHARIQKSSVPDVVSAVMAEGLPFHYPAVRRKRFQTFAQRKAQSFKAPGPQ